MSLNLDEVIENIPLELISWYLNEYDVYSAYQSILDKHIIKKSCEYVLFNSGAIKNTNIPTKILKKLDSTFFVDVEVEKDVLDKTLYSAYCKGLIDPKSFKEENEDFFKITKEFEEMKKSLVKNFFSESITSVFSHFNNLDYEDFIGDFTNIKKAVGQYNSAFAFYLLSHVDPRINLLSFKFIERDENKIKQLPTFTHLDLNSEELLPFKKIITKSINSQEEHFGKVKIYNEIDRILKKGNKLLPYIEKDDQGFYRPKKNNLGAVIINHMRKYTFLKEHHEQRIHNLNLYIQKKENEMNSLKNKNNQLETDIEQIINSQKKVIVEKKPKKKKDKKDKIIKDLNKKYRNLERITEKQFEKITNNESTIKELNQEIIEQKNQIKDQIKLITQYEKQLSKLKYLPALKEYYQNRKILGVIDKQKTKKLGNLLCKISNNVQIVDSGEILKNASKNYDLVIVVATSVKHSERWILDKNQKNVMVYKPNDLHRLIKHIYETQLPDKYKD